MSLINDLKKQKEIEKIKKEPTPGLKEKGLSFLKSELSLEREIKSTFSLTSKEHTNFLTTQLLIMTVMLFLTGAFALDFLLNNPDWEQTIQALGVIWKFLATVFSFFLFCYISLLELHKRKILKNNSRFEIILKKHVALAYEGIDHNKIDWNISIRSIALKSLLASDDYKGFLGHSILRKKKYSLAKVGFEIEQYCYNHIDKLYSLEEKYKEKNNEKKDT